MESKVLQVFLRVLYTVNSNPQYILAKSSSQATAIPCSEVTTQSAENEATYARTPLKACLAAVCASSPELLQDPTRDFSLYVLDPLEAQPLPMRLAPTPQNTNSPRGVAVALGLMSWALESNDSNNVFVTGTIIPSAPPALEVVFALRETKRMPKHIVHMYPGLGPVPVPGTSQPPPQAAGAGWLYASHAPHNQQEQQTLTRSADFPELYIGPPRRARGRPEGSTSSKSKVTSQAGDSGPSSSKAAETQSAPKQAPAKRSKAKTKSRPPQAPPTYSPFICAPLVRHTATGEPESDETGVATFHQQSQRFSQSQTHPQTQPFAHPVHNPLLGLLSTLASTSSGNTSTPEQQVALLSALQGLLATNPQLLQLAATTSTSGEQAIDTKLVDKKSKTDDEHDEGDSDIVILDSSAVDATAFRKRSSLQPAPGDHDASSLAINQDSPMPSSQSTGSSFFPPSTPPSEQENAQTPTSKHASSGRGYTTSHALDVPTTPTPSRTRKRKLGEYVHGQVHPSTSASPPSPSPSVTRASSSGRVLTARQQVQSSPTGGTKSVSLSSARLPSMLGSMRASAASSSRLQSGNQSTALVSGSSKLRASHPGIADASLEDMVSNTISLKRRRTLSEFMAEQEARENTMPRKRSSSGRKLEGDASTNTSQAAPPRSVKVASTSKYTQSSPPRPLFRSDQVASSLFTSTFQPSLVPGAAIFNLGIPMLSSTAPHSSPSKAASTKNPLKNFVLPAWARTSTAMLPRLSEDVLARQQAEREAKKAQVSLKRREAAKAKRRRLGAEHPSKESSEEEDELVASDTKPRTLHPLSSSGVRPADMLPPPLASLPVFASDAVEPIPPSSPPPSLCSFVPPVAPSTPPRKPPSGSAPHRTPGKSGSCSLFTPSGQDLGSLFTPSTPSVTRSLTRATFTPRSPTVLHRSGARKSPRKSGPWTPKRINGSHQTPRSGRAGRNPPFASPSLAIRTPQTQTGMGTRAFLLPPPSPCAARSSHSPRQLPGHARMLGSSTSIVPEGPRTTQPESPSEKQSVEGGKGKGRKEDDVLNCAPDDVLLEEDVLNPLTPCSPTRPTVDEEQETSEPCDTPSNGNAFQAEREYGSSPLPPSSPLPATPFTSPARHQHHESNPDSPTTDDLIVPDSDILFPAASDSDGASRRTANTTTLALLSDDDPTAAWFTDSEAGAWFTETETWLTDTEGGPRPTDSDGAWLSDSDAVFGDLDVPSSLPTSGAASNWLSDDADVDTDGELGTAIESGGFDAAALERAFAVLVERVGVEPENDGADAGGSSTKGIPIDPELWGSLQSLLELNDSAGEAPVKVGAEAEASGSLDHEDEKAAQVIKELWGDLAGTGQ